VIVEESMPLTPGKEQVLTTMMGVKFLMRDGDLEVACRAARGLLRYRFGSRDSDGDEDKFKLHRQEIESAASNKYDAGKLEAHADVTIIVTEADVASSLSRKM
jgi:hypothetical protein